VGRTANLILAILRCLHWDHLSHFRIKSKSKASWKLA